MYSEAANAHVALEISFTPDLQDRYSENLESQISIRPCLDRSIYSPS